MDTARLAETEENDRRRVAAHEAAHLTVALALGWRARAYIWRVDAPVNINDRSWLGRCERRPQRSKKSVGVNRNAVIGIAGVVGEALHEDPDIASFEIEECMAANIDWVPSPTDLALITGCRLRRGTLIDRALHLLRTHKGFWEWATRQLYEEHDVTDGDADDAFAAHIKSGGVIDME